MRCSRNKVASVEQAKQAGEGRGTLHLPTLFSFGDSFTHAVNDERPLAG